MQRLYDIHDTQNNVFKFMKKSKQCRSFHLRYMELCRSRNLTPAPEIRAKSNATSILEIYCDKLSVIEWLLIIESLYYDQVLQTICLRMRKSQGTAVLEHIDTEKKAKLFKQKPAIYTKFVLSGLVEAVTNCIQFNKNLHILKMEGLPLTIKYIESIAKVLASNESLREISLHRSFIGDNGCEAICNTVKYLNHVEKIDISDCNLTVKGAEYVADMIKMQRISRYTEGWEKSLRYRDVDTNSISGLSFISLARNPNIGDEGVKMIAEVLKEDAWVKVINMEYCGLSDRGANIILDCLDMNTSIIDFNVRNNEGISKFLQRNVRDRLGKGEDDRCDNQEGGKKSKKILTLTQMAEEIHRLQEQLSFERTLRIKAEKLNEKLNNQIMSFNNEMDLKPVVPDGYIVVKNESLQSIVREYKNLNYNKTVNSVCTSYNTSPRSRSLSVRHNDFDDDVVGIPNITIEKALLDYECQTKSQQQQNEEEWKPQQQQKLQQKEQERERKQKQLQQQQQQQSWDRHLAEEQLQQQQLQQQQFVQRKPLKVRKVKSEMKYVESNNNSRKHESKSDYEFTNDFNNRPIAQFETDIGDTASINANQGVRNKQNMSYSSAMSNKIDFNYVSEKSSRMHSDDDTSTLNYMDNLTPYHNINTEFSNSMINNVDKLSLSSSTLEPDSEFSSDSETLRNSISSQYTPMKVYVNRRDEDMKDEEDNYSGKSPRSLFLINKVL